MREGLLPILNNGADILYFQAFMFLVSIRHQVTQKEYSRVTEEDDGLWFEY